MTQTPSQGVLGHARKHPWQLVAGLFVGITLTSFALGFIGLLSLFVPLTLSAVTVVFKCTAGLSVGAFAAFSGLLIFAVLFTTLAQM